MNLHPSITWERVKDGYLSSGALGICTECGADNPDVDLTIGIGIFCTTCGKQAVWACEDLLIPTPEAKKVPEQKETKQGSVTGTKPGGATTGCCWALFDLYADGTLQDPDLLAELTACHSFDRATPLTHYIRNVRVYGLTESILASGYPKSTAIPFMDKIGIFTRFASESDQRRATRLYSAPTGSGHDCFLKGIVVQADFIMSHGWWMQAERYHWFDIVSSQSKEHSCKALYGIDDPDDVTIRHRLGARVTTNFLQLKTIYAQRKNHRREEWKIFCKWCEDLFSPFKGES